ncbi:MAG: phytanoyl-CoA dioxygenase family protein [Candidatus Handelsmanbacteria bacterium]|nr:phytanoyl-CoA dioxygenase family protein [Candidatus Handelsmanbacteria bacterium]
MAELTAAQIEFFREQGYLVAPGVIPAGVVEALQVEIDAAIDRQAHVLLAASKITALHADQGFLHRATAIAAECREILAPVDGGRHSGPAMFGLLTCPELLDVVGQLVGPEIVASSVYRIRPKLPFRPEGDVPWHQDSGYFHTMGDAHLILTCWVPLMNATVSAGCMEVVPRSHRHGVVRHYWAEVPAPPLTVHPDHLPPSDPVPVPADLGDVVLLSNLTCHRSTPNTAGVIRWAADLRYNAPEAGDYYPNEAGFLARSKSHPDQVLRDAAAFDRLRREHRPAGAVDRTWLKQAEETFVKKP